MKPWIHGLLAIAFLLGGGGCKSQAPSGQSSTVSAPSAKTTSRSTVATRVGTNKLVVDAEELRRRARGILKALKSRKIDEIVKFVREQDREQARKAFSSGARGTKDFFTPGNWRHRALQTWDGKFGEIRVKGRRARVKFRQNALNGVPYVNFVEVKNYEGTWYFRDIKRRPLKRFNLWGNGVSAPSKP